VAYTYDSTVIPDIKAHILELIALRDRTGRKPLTNEERLGLLHEIYDSLLYLWKQTTLAGQSRGTGALSDQLGKVRHEIEAISFKLHKASTRGRNATPEEVIEYFTDIMRDPNVAIVHRSRAAEDLARTMALFVEHRQIDARVEIEGTRSLLRAAIENDSVAHQLLQLEAALLSDEKLLTS